MPSEYMEQLSQQECFSTRKVVVNGIIFSRELWLPDFFDLANIEINQIVDVVLESNEINSIYVVCKTYSVTHNDHYGCYSVQIERLQDQMKIIKIQDFLLDHQYPVKVHIVNGISMFRNKYF